MGTGFSAHYSNVIWTNGHVALGLLEILRDYASWGPWLFAVKAGTRVGGSDTYEVTGWNYHPAYDGTIATPDVAVLFLEGANFTSESRPQFLSRDMADELQVGQPVATMGFPGEIDGYGTDANTNVPIATFKDGTISALRPYNVFTTSATPENNKVVQHNLGTSGGTSGSPIFDHQGLIVAIHNAGTEKLVFDLHTGAPARVPSGALGFGVRVDEVWTIIEEAQENAKPIALRDPTPRDWHESTGTGPLGHYVPFPSNWNGITVPPLLSMRPK